MFETIAHMMSKSIKTKPNLMGLKVMILNMRVGVKCGPRSPFVVIVVKQNTLCPCVHTRETLN